VPGLGTSFGRGGSTTFPVDMRHADSILIMGSNMAECHPVAFRWVMQAKTRDRNPCTIIHADPRFTRTSAMANIHAPLRAGTDIVFLGALIANVIGRLEDLLRLPEAERQRDRRAAFFYQYLFHYTNAAKLVTEDFHDTEQPDPDTNEPSGLFSGFQAQARPPRYDARTWRYDTEPASPQHNQATPGEGRGHGFAADVGRLVGPPPRRDPTLRNPRCVFQILKRHFARYTPDMVWDVCGTPRDVFARVAQTLWDNAGPDKTGAICYAVGWTQHTTGVQMIRAASVLQLLLGNIGRPGGGILALRGHATIQGSTDIATLYNIHPGYLNTPSALRPHDTLRDYIRAETSPTSYWANFPKFIVSQLKAWYGDAATAANDYAYDFLPKIIGDHSHLPMFVEMSKPEKPIQGFFAMGQNPAVGGQNASYQRKALANLKWLVVRDLYETETATFWKDSPEVRSGQLNPRDVQTEVFFLPAAAVPENDGSFTNTQRLVQWHEKAVDPPGDARSDLWFTYHLGRRLKQLYRDSTEPRDRPIQALVWDYVDEEANRPWSIKDEPSAALVLKEINGYFTTRPAAAARVPGSAAAAPASAAALTSAGAPTGGSQAPLKTAAPLRSFAELTDDGATACGAWIYTGVCAPTPQEPLGHNNAANRRGDDWVSLGWGFAWPANRRLMYNRCSADPAGNPWPKEARLAGGHQGGRRGYVYWDAAQRRWVGLDVPDFVIDKAPDTPGRPDGVGLAYHDGASPFIMKADGKGWLYVPNGLVDGPLPTHYEPKESPVRNALYRSQNNPVALVYNVDGNPYADVASPQYPHVLSTYRLTEHHLSGVMSRWLPWLAELQPELFCEISPEHAEEIGVRNTGWVVIRTPRGSIRAKALVTRRIRPFRLRGDKIVHHVGLPWHWGYKGLVRGDVVNNLSALVGDPNVTIHEAKVFVCNVARG
jgi:formate dehydrogenase major subunit